MKQVNNALNSPWLTISIACIAIVVGYVVFLHSKGEIVASAASQFCPMHYTCQGDNCANSPECANGKCGDGCQGNCPKMS